MSDMPEHSAPQRGGTEIARDLIDRFFNGHDLAVAPEFFARGFRWHGGPVGTVEGIDAYTAMMRTFFTAMPDIRAEEVDVLEDGDEVVARLVVRGTHLGELWGIAPTGRPVVFDAVMIFAIEGGLVVEQWATLDRAAILSAVGALDLPWATR